MKKDETTEFKSRRNQVSRVGNEVTKRFSCLDDFNVESQIYDRLTGNDLAPRIISKGNGCIVTEYIEGDLLFDLSEQTLGDFSKQRYLFGLFLSWCKDFYKKTGYTLGDTNFRNFILKDKKLYGVDFESCTQGSPAMDMAWQSAMLATLRPEYSKERRMCTRLFLSMVCHHLNINEADLAVHVFPSFEEICKRRNVPFNKEAVKEILSTLDIASCILAGGASSRMGQDKRLMNFKDGTLISNAFSSASLFSAQYISTSKDDLNSIPATYKVVHDLQPGLGPLGGIVSLLPSIASPWALFVPCDMPLLSGGMLDYLASFREEAFDAVIFTEMGVARTFPLLLQTKTARPAFQESLANDSLALWRTIKEKLRVLTIPAEDCPAYKLFSLKNINTREDYETLQTLDF